MNYEELLEKINDIGLYAVANDDYPDDELPIELVHKEGGYEGAGEYAERVFKHLNGDETIFIKITGYYSSYSGTEWEEVSQVTPIQKTITVYENVE